MTISVSYPNRGDANPDTRADGRESIFDTIIDEVNGIVANNITAENLFGANTQSSPANITLTTLANLQLITFTSANRTLTLPAANGASSNLVHDGGNYIIRNAGNFSFDVNASSGTKITRILNGQTKLLVCRDDTTVDGLWDVYAGTDEATIHFLHAAYQLGY